MIMYTYGWRVSEVLGLTLAQVDLEARTLRLDPGQTKNGEGRTVYFTPELETLLLHQVERVRSLATTLQRTFGRRHTSFMGTVWAQIAKQS